MQKRKTQSYRENGDLIDLQADKKGFVKCAECKKKIEKEFCYYYDPDCYCKECWKPIDKQHKQEINRAFGGL